MNYNFDATCPECGSTLEFVKSHLMGSGCCKAQLDCTTCRATYRITVSLALVNKAKEYDPRHLPKSRPGAYRWPGDPIRALCNGSTETIATELGTQLSTLRRLFTEGFDDAQADTLACYFGMHPSELWDGWHEHTELLEAEGIC